MKKILFVLFSFIASFNLQAQDITVEPMQYNNAFNSPKEGVLGDVGIADGVRVVYGYTILPVIKNVNGDKLAMLRFGAIGVQKGDNTLYGFTLLGSLKTPTSIKTDGKVLIKTEDDKTYEATILYGCNEETHTSTTYSPSLTNTPTARNVSASLCYAHVVMSEEQFTELCNKDIVKIRLETNVSHMDIELKGGKLKSQFVKSYKSIKEALSRSSSGFDNGF